MKVRTRFAPSPTGPLHMGGARTALFNYLFAKQRKGTFILRIEDTDKERSAKEWEEDIKENLQWLGLQWDEFSLQSERVETHQKYLQQLLEQGKAYWCFCTAEDLEAQRQDQASRGEAPRYAGTCRKLSKEEQQKRSAQGRGGVIRFVLPPVRVSFRDLVRGKVEMDASLIGDIVIAKDLQTPLYNFTAAVDDYDMKITHVIRGEDHLPNTPKQILLQEALGFPRPEYAHLPLLLGEDRTKLSKRHGDNSVALFREQGYLPAAIVNFLALLGWNPGTEQEVFSTEQLLKEFSLERVQKAGAVFNVKRLDWLNGTYIRSMDLLELTDLAIPHLQKTELVGESPDRGEAAKAVGLYQERLKYLAELPQLVDFLFQEKLAYKKEMLRWKDAADKRTLEALTRVGELLAKIPEEEWDEETIQRVLLPEAEKEQNRGYLLWPLRVALSGKEASAGPFEIAQVLGKEKTLGRIEQAKTRITSNN